MKQQSFLFPLVIKTLSLILCLTCFSGLASAKQSSDQAYSAYNIYNFSRQTISAVQNKLNSLHYSAGQADGLVGAQTRSAVAAFEKQNGLHIDGVIDQQLIKKLASSCQPRPVKQVSGYLTQVDLAKQVLSVFRNGQLIRILPVSTGSGKAYRRPNGTTAIAKTPTGTFKIIRKLKGVHHSYLGVLFNPAYITNGGIAIHGEPEVPYFPASHGCIRIPVPDSVWYESTLPVGSVVTVLPESEETGCQ